MPAPPPVPSTFVDDPETIHAALDRVDAPEVGLDVERADSARYFRRAAVVQLGGDGCCVLFDAVRLDDLGILDRFLADRLVVLHALENDLEPLANLGVRPSRVADTAVAAALLGLPTGLGALLEQVLGLSLPGDKEAFQRADWAVRPLSPEMIAYAAGDVVHLPRLWEELAARLGELGRTGWYEQELEAAVSRAFDANRDWTRVKGSAGLDPQQRAVLRELWEEREHLARTHDVAPNRLLHDDVLRVLAADPPATRQELVERSPRRRRQLRRYADALLTAVERGLTGPPAPHDPAERSSSPRDRDAFDALRRRRADIARELGLDAGVLCPSRPLWRAVAGAPTSGVELCALAGLRPWQAELLADPLWEAFERVRDGSRAD